MTIKWSAKPAITGLVLAAFAVVAHSYMPPRSTPLFSELLRSLHGPGFAAIATMIYLAIRPRQLILSRYLIAAASAGLIALLAEISQFLGNRNAEVVDLLVDATGIAAALGLIALLDADFRKQASRPLRALLAMATGAALAVTLLPTAWLAYAYVQQQKAFPSLLNFEHRWESATYYLPEGITPKLIAAPANWPEPGSKVALVRKGERDRVFLILHPPPDWRNYRAVSFVAASRDEPFSLDVAIRYSNPAADVPSTFFEKGFTLSAKARRFSIAFNEIAASDVDWASALIHVESLTFSPTRPGSVQHLLIGDIRLEP